MGKQEDALTENAVHAIARRLIHDVIHTGSWEILVGLEDHVVDRIIAAAKGRVDELNPSDEVFGAAWSRLYARPVRRAQLAAN